MSKGLLWLVLGLLVVSFTVKGGVWNMLRKKPYPEVFFDGELQTVAKAIKAKDRDRIIELGSQLDDIDARGNHNVTLLWFAVNDENPIAIKALIELGADPAVYVPEMGTVGYHAMWRKSIEPLKTLLDNGMSPDLKQSNGSRRLLFDTPELIQSDALKLLIEYGADVNARDSLGNTPLLHIMSTSFDEALYLLDHGADGHVMTHSGLSVAYSAQDDLNFMDKETEAYQKMLKIKQKLVDQGVEFPALSPWGERFVNGIVFCKEPHGYRPRAECKVEGVNEFVMEQPEHLKRQDEQILRERFGIEHHF